MKWNSPNSCVTIRGPSRARSSWSSEPWPRLLRWSQGSSVITLVSIPPTSWICWGRNTPQVGSSSSAKSIHFTGMRFFSQKKKIKFLDFLILFKRKVKLCFVILLHLSPLILSLTKVWYFSGSNPDLFLISLNIILLFKLILFYLSIYKVLSEC